MDQTIPTSPPQHQNPSNNKFSIDKFHFSISKKNLPFILFILLLLITGTVYFFLQLRPKAKSQTPSTSRLLEISPTPPSLNTQNIDNWATYTNDEQGFSIKMPKEFKQKSNGKSKEVWYIDFEGENPYLKYSIIINKSLNPTNGEGKSAENPEGPPIKTVEESFLGVENLQSFTLQGYPAARAVEGEVGVAFNLYEHVLQNNILWTISMRIDSPTESDRLLGEKILSTFRFLTQERTKSNQNVIQFESKKLNIAFSYLKQNSNMNFATYEEGDTVYIYDILTMQPKQGQFVEVFWKDENESLEETIKKKFLRNKPESECFVQDYPFATKNLASNFQAAEIAFPLSENADLEEMSKMTNFCSEAYAKTNGNRYFLMDKNVPTKFLFFSIGQYGIRASENTSWQDTIEIKN